jgi:hypothetical protein
MISSSVIPGIVLILMEPILMGAIAVLRVLLNSLICEETDKFSVFYEAFNQKSQGYAGFCAMPGSIMKRTILVGVL